MANNPASVGAKTIIDAEVVSRGYVTEISMMPKFPDKVVMIADTGGLEPNPKFLLDFPSLQILVRGNTSGYLDAFAMIKACKDLLLGFMSSNIDDDQWVSIIVSSDIQSLGQDEESRPMLSVNFRLIIEPSSNSLSNRVSL